MERTYGKSYDKAKTAKEIAALVRGQIKADVKAGRLPDAKYSVRYSAYSMGRSIDVSIEPTANVADWINVRWADEQARNPHRWTETSQYSALATGVIKTLEAMLGAHNHDGSDSQTDYYDVKFYGSVQLRLGDATARVVESRRDAIATGQGDDLVQPMSPPTRAVVDAVRNAVRRVTMRPKTSGSTTYWTIEHTATRVLEADAETAARVADFFDTYDAAHTAARAAFPNALIAV
jgi:hypothetical protein